MKKIVNYVYLGTNGTIMSPVHLEGIYYIRKYKLQAEEGKKLTSDGKNFFQEIYVSEDELNDWTEVDK